MTLYAKNKRTPPPPRRGSVHSRLRLIGLLLTTAAAALLITGCPPPGGGDTTPTGGNADKPGGDGEGTKPGGGPKPPGTTPGGGVTKPAVFTTTVSGTVQDKAFSTGLSGVKVSALTAPANPENKPAASGPDGSFTLRVKHSGTFKLAVGNTACYDDLTTADISASADGAHDAGAIGLTARPEPTTDATRAALTPTGPKKFKLTVNCIREITNGQFHSLGTIITAKAAEEGITSRTERLNMITEISLPPTLTKIGTLGLANHRSMSGTLTIPRNVETIGDRAFMSLRLKVGYVIFNFESGSRLKTIGQGVFQTARLRDFTLPENLETIGEHAFSGTRFTSSSTAPITLTIPAKVRSIGNQAFRNPGGASLTGITVVEILSDALAKPSGASRPFPLGDNLFQGVTGITEIRLPRAVHDSYTAAERTAIFGSITLKPR